MFFNSLLAKTGLTFSNLSKLCKVNKRSFSDWKKGYSMPLEVFKKLLKISGLRPSYQVLPDYWHVQKAGKQGGISRIHMYGNPGTPEGRIRGGKISYRKFLLNPSARNNFIAAKPFRYPKKSVALAEFFGILLGDGGISRYQVTISLNKITDRDFSEYVKKLIIHLFKIQPSYTEDQSVIRTVISSVKFVRFLLDYQLLAGDKVRNQIIVPDWILKKPVYIKACMRGLLDTDGCFYVDKHRYKEKVYLNAALNFSNHSLPILDFFKMNLERFGFHPTQKTKYAVFLRQEQDIIRYFQEIGSSNPKHFRKFKYYFQNKYGEVPKWS